MTAETADDVVDLVAETYREGHRPRVRRIIEDVDVGDLADDLEKVIHPLILGVPLGRGIWYPNLTGP